jgi:murein DD-endopeptidase MepM/ murein hydrolase activator NlpD
MDSPWDGFHTFFIDHENGFSSWYLHCDHLTKEIADILLPGGLPNYDAYVEVDSGQEIAVSGDWGSEGSYHLHFEVRQGKQIINPDFLELAGVKALTLESNNQYECL